MRQNKIKCEYPTFFATIPWCSECYYSKSMVNNGDVQIEKSSDRLIAHSVLPVQLVFFDEFKRFKLTGSHSAVRVT